LLSEKAPFPPPLALLGYNPIPTFGSYSPQIPEALDRLEHVAPALSIEVAFDLYHALAIPWVEIHSDAERAPDQCIVHDQGRLVGFFDASVPPSIIRTHRGEAGKPGPEEVASRALVAEFSEQVELDEVNSLLVSISSEEAIAGIAVQALSVGTTIDIVVQARRGLCARGRGGRESDDHGCTRILASPISTA
jgi:hypothetical protein